MRREVSGRDTLVLLLLLFASRTCEPAAAARGDDEAASVRRFCASARTRCANGEPRKQTAVSAVVMAAAVKPQAAKVQKLDVANVARPTTAVAAAPEAAPAQQRAAGGRWQMPLERLKARLAALESKLRREETAHPRVDTAAAATETAAKDRERLQARSIVSGLGRRLLSAQGQAATPRQRSFPDSFYRHFGGLSRLEGLSDDMLQHVEGRICSIYTAMCRSPELSALEEHTLQRLATASPGQRSSPRQGARRHKAVERLPARGRIKSREDAPYYMRVSEEAAPDTARYAHVSSRTFLRLARLMRQQMRSLAQESGEVAVGAPMPGAERMVQRGDSFVYNTRAQPAAPPAGPEARQYANSDSRPAKQSRVRGAQAASKPGEARPEPTQKHVASDWPSGSWHSFSGIDETGKDYVYPSEHASAPHATAPKLHDDWPAHQWHSHGAKDVTRAGLRQQRDPTRGAQKVTRQLVEMGDGHGTGQENVSDEEKQGWFEEWTKGPSSFGPGSLHEGQAYPAKYPERQEDGSWKPDPVTGVGPKACVYMYAGPECGRGAIEGANDGLVAALGVMPPANSAQIKKIFSLHPSTLRGILLDDDPVNPVGETMFFVIPALHDYPAVPHNTKIDIQEYVRSGHTVLNMGGVINIYLMNQLFGLELVPHYSPGPYLWNEKNCPGTPFEQVARKVYEQGNSRMGLTGVALASLPYGAESYFDNDGASVALCIPLGKGRACYVDQEWIRPMSQYGCGVWAQIVRAALNGGRCVHLDSPRGNPVDASSAPPVCPARLIIPAPPPPPPPTPTTTTSPAPMHLTDCRNGCGRVEVENDGEWGTVCDDGWSESNTKVVCRVLGCASTGGRAVVGGGGYGMAFGGGQGKIWMDGVHCSGDEESLNLCDFEGWGHHNCIHDEDVGVCCEGCPDGVGCPPGGPRAHESEISHDEHDGVDVEGDLEGHDYEYAEGGLEHHAHAGGMENANARLADCRGDGCCRIEFQQDGEWGTVCDDGWTEANTAVACRSVGCSATGASAVLGGEGYGEAFGGGTGQIWLDDVQCTGDEAWIGECEMPGWGDHNCIHDEDVGICCQGCPADLFKQTHTSTHTLAVKDKDVSRDEHRPAVAHPKQKFPLDARKMQHKVRQYGAGVQKPAEATFIKHGLSAKAANADLDAYFAEQQDRAQARRAVS